MFNAIKKQIIGAGTKAGKTPYSNIPIFDDVGIIGMPGIDGGSAFDTAESESKGRKSKADSADTFNTMSPTNSIRVEGRASSGKRSRGHRDKIDSVDDMIYDKENIPRIPNANAIRIDYSDAFGKDASAKKPRRAVTIQESRNSSMHPEASDSRFTTDRPLGQRVSFTGSRGGNSEESKGDDEDEVLVEDVESDDDSDAQAAQKPAAGQHINDDEVEERLTMRAYLFSKVRHNHCDVVEKCIKGGRHDFTGRFSVDDYGNTLMHVAVQNNLKKMCSMLLKSAGCELSAENLKGMTPLDYAELYHFTPLADWLLERGAMNGTSPRK